MLERSSDLWDILVWPKNPNDPATQASWQNTLLTSPRGGLSCQEQTMARIRLQSPLAEGAAKSVGNDARNHCQQPVVVRSHKLPQRHVGGARMRAIRADDYISAILEEGNGSLAGYLKADVIAIRSPIVFGLDEAIRHEVEAIPQTDAHYCQLYAEQQALAWALEPGGYASPLETIQEGLVQPLTDTREGSADCSDRLHRFPSSDTCSRIG